MKDHTKIKDIIKTFNNAWFHKDYEKLGDQFSSSVIFRSPDFKFQVEGKEACTKTFKDFMDNARVSKFDFDDITINFRHRIALATYHFNIEYVMNDKFSKESGTDILVFEEVEDNWLLSWRAMCNLKTE